MVRFLKRRRLDPVEYIARDHRQTILDTARVKRCAVCTFEVPESDIIVEDNIERCPMCADTYTTEYLIAEQQAVNEVKLRAAHSLVLPLQTSSMPLSEPRTPAITLMADNVTGAWINQQNPLRLTRGGPNVGMTWVGRYLTSAITFTYPSGVTENTPPIITSTHITFDLIASGGMQPGEYSMDMNDGVSTYAHRYINILSVR